MAQEQQFNMCEGCMVRVTISGVVVEKAVSNETEGQPLGDQCPRNANHHGGHKMNAIQSSVPARSNDEANKTPLMFTVNGWFSPPGIVDISQDVSRVIFDYLNDPQDLHRYSTEFVPEMSVLFDKDACKTNIDFFKCWLDDIPSTIMERYAILHEDEEKEEDEDEEEEEDDFEDRRDTRLCLIKTKIQSPFASE
eukprot:1026647_1